ncbi:MAG: hypothetical protein CL840_16330, partial [Crocinitomicaceae bacterium]|nr:hypothetical protein [Crocinitomicaceae bacterium]
MPTQTDFDIDPYWDDFDETKNFYKMLFKPGVAVQTRELNQLQSILQNQIERFGDNVFKRGTIIEGCNITLHSQLPYVKINDLETDGTQVVVGNYEKLYARNAANTVGYIAKTESGFETQAPNLNTLFLKYINSGSDGVSGVFSANDVLTIYSPSYPIFKYRVNDGSSSFSNNDTLVVTSAIAVQNSTGGNSFPVGAWNVNDVIQNGVANAVIVEANTTANSDYLVLKVKPLSGDLATGNTTLWRFANAENILNSSTANTGKIVGVIGFGATGSITTDSLGKITSVTVANSGTGYYVPPQVSVSITSSGSAASNTDISQVDVDALNFLTNVTVANNAQLPVGFGFGATVDNGIIYQKGYFSRVSKQLIVVNKYSNTGFDKSLGFYTDEEIITSRQDTSLLDNATGTPNETAPGADRLKLTPQLRSLSKIDANANTEFLPIIEFSDGVPYKNAKQTVYNIIGDEIARRASEESGDYVIDQFNLTTRSSNTFIETDEIFKVVIDPGKAYINGFRIETTGPFSGRVDKGLTEVNNPGGTVRVGYGNYVLVDELAGIFQFNFGDIVTLYDSPANYLSTTPGAAISPTGASIGTARIRSLLLDSGEPGTPTARYRLYLFDIVMNSGKNFSNVRSIYYNGVSTDGICDTIPDGSGAVQLIDFAQNALMFKAADAVKDANAVTYTYRTMDLSLNSNTTGFIDLPAPSGTDSFPYADGQLSTVAERDILVISFGSYHGGANIAGSVQASSTNTDLVGTGTDFTANFRAGDFIKVANSTTSETVQVQSVTNTTFLTLTANAGTTISGNAVLFFPNNAPISLTNRSSRTVTKEANGHLTINLGTTIANATSLASASANVAVVYNVTANSSIPVSKTLKREIYVRIDASNNAGGVAGPWALGVPDVFRLRNVYRRVNGASNTTINVDAADVDDVNDFISATSNPFANGDSVLYTGASPITGLSDGNTYFIVEANSSGFGLSNTRGGAKLPISPAGANVHTFEGKPFYFGPDTSSVEDVTNDYYIDNNQKEAYLDTSYLYQKPRIPDLGA